MFTKKFKKSVNSKITKVFSYIVLVFAFFLVRSYYQNMGVGAALGSTTGSVSETGTVSIKLHDHAGNYYYGYVCKASHSGSGGTTSGNKLVAASGCALTEKVDKQNTAVEFEYNKDNGTLKTRHYAPGVLGIGKGWKDWHTLSFNVMSAVNSLGLNYKSEGYYFGVINVSTSCMGSGCFLPVNGGSYKVPAAAYATITVTLPSKGWAKSHSVSISASSTTSTVTKRYYHWNQYSSWCYGYSGTTPQVNDCVNSLQTMTSGSTASKSSVTGSYRLIAFAGDAYGNWGYASRWYDFDNQAPTHSGFYATSGGSYQKSTSIGARLQNVTDNSKSGLSTWVYMCLDTSSTLTGSDLYSLLCDYIDYDIGKYTSLGYFSDDTIPSGTYYLYVYAEDNVGNYTWAKADGTYYVDNTLPTIDSGTTSSSTTYVKSKSVTIKYYDYHSKVNNIKYCWTTSSSGCTPSTSVTATVSGNYGTISLTKTSVTGIYYIYFYAIDKAGNQSTTSSRYYYIDNDVPDFSSASPSSDTNYTKSKSITVTYSDVYSGANRSGVKSILYCWTTSSSGCTPGTELASTGSLTIAKSDGTGIYYLSTYAFDNATNYSGVTTSGPYYFDNEAPTRVNWTASPGLETWTKTVNQTLEYTDNNRSGVSEIYYCWSTTTTCSSYSSVTATNGLATIDRTTGTGKYYFFFYAVDAAGNTSGTVYSSSEFYLDNTKPTVSSVTPGSSTSYSKSKTVEVKYYDVHSKVKKIYYCWTTSSSGCTPTSSKTATVSGDYGTVSITRSTGTGIYYLSLKA